jgi:hypothetical protein
MSVTPSPGAASIVAELIGNCYSVKIAAVHESGCAPFGHVGMSELSPLLNKDRL